MIARFPCLHIEGNLISFEVIDDIADGKALGQSPQDFGVKNRKLIDDIASAWSEAKAYWTLFLKKTEQIPEEDYGTSITRDRWVLPLMNILGYEMPFIAKADVVDSITFPISHRASNREDAPPIHIVGFRQDLGEKDLTGKTRYAPHSLMQEYLNRTEYLWGIVTNGYTLRLLRNSSLLRKQSYIEMDIRQIMQDDHFADFVLLYRLLHISRMPIDTSHARDSLLEKYHQQTIEQGGRVRDHLRDGVEKAIIEFGNGFLSHPKNEVLRQKVRSGELTPFEYYQQTLRLIYRLLFLMVSEERGLISDNISYRENYSITRVRRLVESITAYTHNSDIWMGMNVALYMFYDEKIGQLLDVPTLNGELFDPDRTLDLNYNFLMNKDLLTAMRFICMYREDEKSPLRRINYSALDVEELGSVYESLLEFHPIFSESNGKLVFELQAGTERKSTGSYYTPPELVNELIHSALVPVMRERLAEAKTEDTKETILLGMTVCDPACGSGHFLLAAARTIGKELAKARTGDNEPSPQQMRIAIRDAITHCIYGVDKNPLAVELCKVALWIEGHTMNKPLTFLDHRVRCGDSIVGVFSLSVLKEGIPDDAFTAVTGDDKTVVKEIKKKNKNERLHRSLTIFDTKMHSLVESRKPLIETPDNTPEQIRQKGVVFRSMQQEGTQWCKDKTACDLWVSAFFVELTEHNVVENLIPTTENIRAYIGGNLNCEISQALLARQLAKQNRFFHWFLEFPEVFERGGFDCVLGNPPWERIKLQEQEFFSAHDPKIANAVNKAARQKLIDLLETDNPNLAKAFRKNKHAAEAESKFVRTSGRFKQTAIGDINSYALFAELSRDIRKPNGRSGIIVPTGIATDDSLKNFFVDLLTKKQLIELIGFINNKKIFPAIKDYIKFCLLIIGSSDKPEFMFLLTDVQQIRDNRRRFSVSAEELQLLNPNTGNAPIFRTRIDAELTIRIYRNIPVLQNERLNLNPWQISFIRMIDMSNDSHLFVNEPVDNSVMLYEAKMVYHFDHRFSTYENATQANINEGNLPQCTSIMHADPCFRVLPRYWIPGYIFDEKCKDYCERAWYIGFRGISAGANERTLISSIIPKVAAGNSIPLIQSKIQNSILLACLNANLNSLVLDYVARLKVGGPNLNFFIVKQLPVLPSEKYLPSDLSFIVPRVIELVYTAWDIKAFADDIWHDADASMKAIIKKQHEANYNATGGNKWNPPDWLKITADGICLPPFKWDEERRAILRAELDAYNAKLYGLTRDELRYILNPIDIFGPEFPGETFRVLREKEIKKYGEYRTGRLVLEAWDRMK